MDFDLNLENYKHNITIQVRSYETDFQGVVNNAVFFNYFELARIEFSKYLFMQEKGKDKHIGENLNFVVAHNECDYINPVFFDDELIVYTKINYIKNSSFSFLHIIKNKTRNNIAVYGSGVIVQIDMKTKKSFPLTQEFKSAIINFDKQVQIIEE